MSDLGQELNSEEEGIDFEAVFNIKFDGEKMKQLAIKHGVVSEDVSESELKKLEAFQKEFFVHAVEQIVSN